MEKVKKLKGIGESWESCVSQDNLVRYVAVFDQHVAPNYLYLFIN